MADLEKDNRQSGAGDPFTNVAVRRPFRPSVPRWKRLLKGALRALGAAVLLAAGTVWTLRQTHPQFVKPGELLHLPPALVTAAAPGTEPYAPPTDSAALVEIQKVAFSLRKYTNDTVLARRIASAIVVEGGKKNIDPALLVGVVLTEDAKLDPNAKSFVGARGLMQVMPFHAGKWKGCSSADLFAIDSNICHGVSILADLIKRSPSVSSALQRYNGCVRGTNTPNCHTYSGKVLKFAEQAASQMLGFSTSQ
ncbi:MAG TPA: lytic transglycosylase domain-containing protein [Gemmatimonadaceae bacterium]|jgi:soluble lytic murein transglycosylase-like protein|nr:lytic transglycosylase domain-containing protein [Gemmatimonadaceae bacterium]